MEQEPRWQRQVLLGVAALLVVGLLLGGLLAVVVVKAADQLGVGDTGSGSDGPAPILPTTGAATKTAPPPTTPGTTSPTTHSTHHQRTAIALSASPHAVAAGQRINLTGSYPGHEGTRLQVQRSIGSGGWTDFPTTATVQAGRFATYVETSIGGKSRFRMLDESSGHASNVVTVTIG